MGTPVSPQELATRVIQEYATTPDRLTVQECKTFGLDNAQCVVLVEALGKGKDGFITDKEKKALSDKRLSSDFIKALAGSDGGYALSRRVEWFKSQATPDKFDQLLRNELLDESIVFSDKIFEAIPVGNPDFIRVVYDIAINPKENYPKRLLAVQVLARSLGNSLHLLVRNVPDAPLQLVNLAQNQSLLPEFRAALLDTLWQFPEKSAVYDAAINVATNLLADKNLPDDKKIKLAHSLVEKGRWQSVLQSLFSAGSVVYLSGVVDLLGQKKKPAAIGRDLLSALIKFAEDPKQDVEKRIKSLELLTSFYAKSPEVGSLLKRILDNTQENPRVFKTVVGVTAKTDEEYWKIVFARIEATKDAAIIDVFADSVKSLDVLMPYAKNPSEAVRLALARMGRNRQLNAKPAMQVILYDLRNDPSAKVKKEALNHLSDVPIEWKGDAVAGFVRYLSKKGYPLFNLSSLFFQPYPDEESDEDGKHYTNEYRFTTFFGNAFRAGGASSDLANKEVLNTFYDIFVPAGLNPFREKVIVADSVGAQKVFEEKVLTLKNARVDTNENDIASYPRYVNPIAVGTSRPHFLTYSRVGDSFYFRGAIVLVGDVDCMERLIFNVPGYAAIPNTRVLSASWEQRPSTNGIADGKSGFALATVEGRHGLKDRVGRLHMTEQISEYGDQIEISFGTENRGLRVESNQKRASSSGEWKLKVEGYKVKIGYSAEMDINTWVPGGIQESYVDETSSVFRALVNKMVRECREK